MWYATLQIYICKWNGNIMSIIPCLTCHAVKNVDTTLSIFELFTMRILIQHKNGHIKKVKAYMEMLEKRLNEEKWWGFQIVDTFLIIQISKMKQYIICGLKMMVARFSIHLPLETGTQEYHSILFDHAEM